MPNPRKRDDFRGPTTLVRGLTHAGWATQARANCSGLMPHDHGPAYELCLIVDGCVEWWVEDEVHEVGPGEVYLTRPNERHGGIDHMLHPAELYWCGFLLPGPRGGFGLNPQEAAALAQRFAAIRYRHFPGDTTLADSFARLIEAMRDGGELAPIAAKTAFIQLLLQTLRCHDQRAASTRHVSPDIQRAMRWIDRRLGEDFAIEEAAAVAGLSVTRFHERFREELGYSPGDWRTRQRVRQAKRMLRSSDTSILDIALRCGFATSQYFATVFGKHTGMSPRVYRDSHRGAE